MSYDDSVHTLMATANWQAMDKLSFNFGIAFSMAQSEMEDIYFVSDPHTNGDRLDAATPWKGTYDVVNTNEMESYSKLEYNTLDLNMEALYSITDNIDLTVKYLLTNVDDQENYVYGDESGLYHSLRAWVTFRF
ncbi:MAG TPA: hypothetical protein ENK96_04620 [Desulfobulbaceae bacterium]|nr:hypothetical protein [Desulfobulbaceae bacterium]